MIVTIFTTISQKGDPVKISTKTRYGMRFMIDLAQSQGEGRVALKDIADRQGLSKKYLEQVVAPLASAGLLDVTRGNQGGYRLSRDASAITLADIVAASEDGLELLDCMGSLSACERAEDCPSRRVWGGLQVAIGDYLSGLTLADVASSAAAANLQSTTRPLSRIMCNYLCRDERGRCGRRGEKVLALHSCFRSRVHRGRRHAVHLHAADEQPHRRPGEPVRL